EVVAPHPHTCRKEGVSRLNALHWPVCSWRRRRSSIHPCGRDGDPPDASCVRPAAALDEPYAGPRAYDYALSSRAGTGPPLSLSSPVERANSADKRINFWCCLSGGACLSTGPAADQL